MVRLQSDLNSRYFAVVHESIYAGDVSLKTSTKLLLWVCLYTIMMYLIAKENCRCLSLPLTGHLWVSVLAVLIVWFGLPSTYHNEAFMAALTLDNSEGSVCNDNRGVLMLSLCFYLPCHNRYIRIYGVHNTVNKVFHLVHFECSYSNAIYELGEDGVIGKEWKHWQMYLWRCTIITWIVVFETVRHQKNKTSAIRKG